MTEWFCHVTCFTKVSLLLQGRRESESADRKGGGWWGERRRGKKIFFQLKSENINFLNVNNIWDFSLFIEHDISDKK